MVCAVMFISSGSPASTLTGIAELEQACPVMHDPTSLPGHLRSWEPYDDLSPVRKGT